MKDIENDKIKLDKAKLKGKLSPNDEVKWREKILKKEEKLQDYKSDLEKAEKKVNKLD